MKFIVAGYRIRADGNPRKGARRKELFRINADNSKEALKMVKGFKKDGYTWELLTGDWKHIIYEGELNEELS